jgi:polysaccharide export outer membrane protein
MKMDTNFKTSRVDRREHNQPVAFPLIAWGLALWLLAGAAGCQTNSGEFIGAGMKGQTNAVPETVTLREGDILKISFPGSPSLDTTQQIRRDGKVTLPLVGEVQAAGLTTETLQQDLVKLYAPQLATKQVIVMLASSTFPVFVTGSVIRPGKIMSDHPITALDAIMEAGGFDYTRANLKAVRVIRHEGDRVVNYTLNLKMVLEGKTAKQFYLQPSDIVFVPERFAIF